MVASKSIQRLGRVIAGRSVAVVFDPCPPGVNGFATWGIRTSRAPWVIVDPARDQWAVLETLCHECLHWKSGWPQQGDHKHWADIVESVAGLPGKGGFGAPDNPVFIAEEFRVRAGAAALVGYARRFEGTLEQVADQLAAALERGEVTIVDDIHEGV